MHSSTAAILDIKIADYFLLSGIYSLYYVG